MQIIINVVLPLIVLITPFVLVYFIVKSRLQTNTKYMLALALALLAGFLLIWINLAVGIIGEPENSINLIFFGMMLIGGISALMVRMRPQPMALILITMAIGQLVAALGVIFLDLHSASNTPANAVIGMNGLIAGLWALSGYGFWLAANQPPFAQIAEE